MAVEQGRFESGDDAELESLSTRWLADLRAQPDFSTRDEYLLERIQKTGRATSMFANQQRLRQARNGPLDTGQDIIGDQLRMLRDVFGHP